ncbi:Uncharacterised protein [Serratia proteamaculans]|uniref:hypothetical protein n=1 Tax=Serratia proteamaculans TaxID=28151 RepID=UPI00217B2363|nr:hypothetical protein [Serratia proteamaculans]CAI0724385.1 Uncharacterised protein [Serratia proteamaculans]CAI1520421.1 Uncharacterised protein [Serratia proteamaculans]
MKERPVIFNGEMVRAILSGRKTQTRRVMKVQPEYPELGLRSIVESTNSDDIGKYFWSQSDACGANKSRSKAFPCPFGQVGDRLWVRETFMDLTGTGIEATTGKFEGFAYRADTPAGSYGDEIRKEYGLKWTPSLHMPRAACRILLEITAVRVERLNDISEEDAKVEGVVSAIWFAAKGVPEDEWVSLGKRGAIESSHINQFATLWESIYGVESWNANPWVWVIEFKRVGGSDASK